MKNTLELTAEIEEIFNSLSAEQSGKLIKAIFLHFRGLPHKEFDDQLLRIAWVCIKLLFKEQSN